jgi:hypothetical protein
MADRQSHESSSQEPPRNTQRRRFRPAPASFQDEPSVGARRFDGFQRRAQSEIRVARRDVEPAQTGQEVTQRR